MVFQPFGKLGPTWASKREYNIVRAKHIRRALENGKSKREALKEWHEFFREWARKNEARAKKSMAKKPRRRK